MNIKQNITTKTFSAENESFYNDNQSCSMDYSLSVCGGAYLEKQASFREMSYLGVAIISSAACDLLLAHI